MMDKRFWINDMPKYSMMIFIVLNLAAMFFYPGGNINNPNQIGYSFIHNFFSDLGMTVSHSNENNMLSCVLFNSSLCLSGVCFGMLFYTVRNSFGDYKFLSLFATFLGLYGSISYIGVAFTPSNLYLSAHIFFAHWIFRSLFAASMIYSILIFKTKKFENKYAYGFITFGFMVLGYILYSELYLGDPRLFPEQLMNHVVAQKVIAFWIFISIYMYSRGLSQYLLEINE